MFERLIYTALHDGIAELVADPRRVRLVFSHVKGLSDAEAARIADLLRRLPPSVAHGYPRDDSSFPLFSIILNEEDESQKFLDDAGGVIDEGEAEFFGDQSLEGVFKRTSVYTAHYPIWVTTDSPDTTIAYYQIAKYLLTKKRAFFKERGALDTHLRGGDLAPNMQYLPAFLFIRQLTMTCMFEEPVFDTLPDTQSPVHSVTGIFTDDGSSITRLGGVEAQVTPTTDE